MNRFVLGLVSLCGLSIASSADAQVFVYDAPASVYVPGAVFTQQVYSPPVYSQPVYAQPVYSQPVVVQSSGVVTSSYYAPAYVPSGVVQMSYSAPVVVPARTVIAAPVVVGPTLVRETTRVTPHHYSQTVRTNGPTGPHYSRVHVHSGPFGTTVRERVR